MELKHTGNKDPARSFKVWFSRVEVLKPRFPRARVLNHCFQLLGGRLRSIEEILDRDPSITNLRDPPELVGQRICCVLVFHSGPGKPDMMSLTYTDPALSSASGNVDKEMSKLLAETVFGVAGEGLEVGGPDKVRADLLISL